jgi:hypothetical protein
MMRSMFIYEYIIFSCVLSLLSWLRCVCFFMFLVSYAVVAGVCVCVDCWYGWCLERPCNVEYSVTICTNHIYLMMNPCDRNIS